LRRNTSEAWDRLAAMGGIGEDEPQTMEGALALTITPKVPGTALAVLQHVVETTEEAANYGPGHNAPPQETGEAFETREQWLAAFMRYAAEEFKARGHDIPNNIRASIGFPSNGVRGKAIGECWSDTASEDGHFEIFVSPVLNSASRIADVVTHEMCHAATPGDGHGKKFGKVARSMGLEGKLTATTAGEEWHAWADAVLAKLGPLPGAALRADFRTKRKVQGTRLIKATCPACELTLRITRKWYNEAMGELMCPNSQVHMRVEAGEDGDDLPVHDGTLLVCEGVDDEPEGEE
jgi:hypothetical protein